jgi:prepilin-type N-terminal cleavage/methylation domain-containing protein
LAQGLLAEPHSENSDAILKTSIIQCTGDPSRQRAFSLVEVTVGTALLAVVAVALASGMNNAAAIAQLNTENLRATQILTEKMDLLRACTWNQITNPGNFLPSSFSAPFYASSTLTNGPNFSGTVDIANAPVSEAYAGNLRQITVTVTWTSAHIVRSRSMTTFASPYGIQNYAN